MLARNALFRRVASRTSARATTTSCLGVMVVTRDNRVTMPDSSESSALHHHGYCCRRLPPPYSPPAASLSPLELSRAHPRHTGPQFSSLYPRRGRPILFPQ